MLEDELRPERVTQESVWRADGQTIPGEAFFRTMVEGIRDYAIFALDARGVVLSWNAGAEMITGYRAEEIVGEHFSRFYTPTDVEAGRPASELEMEVLERMAHRLKTHPERMRLRSQLVEHPFGTMRRGMNQGHFLLRGLKKAAAEMSLTVLCYEPVAGAEHHGR
jgi:PAS domain S-box-containing protein